MALDESGDAVIDAFFGAQKLRSTGIIVKGPALDKFVVEIDACAPRATDGGQRIEASASRTAVTIVLPAQPPLS